MRRCAADIRICRFSRIIGLKEANLLEIHGPSGLLVRLLLWKETRYLMKHIIRIATPLIAVALMSGATLAHAQNNQAPTTENRSWNTPPPGTEQAQAAYKDGVESAQIDKVAQRKVEAKSSYKYVHPPVKSAARDEYRANFTAGYEAAVKHSAGE